MTTPAPERLFSLTRLRAALWRDETAPVEALVGLALFAFLGALMLLGLTSFPPADVSFLLRRAYLTEWSLGILLVAVGLGKVLALCLPWRELRAWLALFGLGLCVFIALAYIWANATPYFQAWASYMGLGLIEGWTALRNWRDKKRAAVASGVARSIVRDIDRES